MMLTFWTRDHNKLSWTQHLRWKEQNVMHFHRHKRCSDIWSTSHTKVTFKPKQPCFFNMANHSQLHRFLDFACKHIRGLKWLISTFLITYFDWLYQHRFCAHNVAKLQKVTLSAVWTHLTLTKKDTRENVFSWLVAIEIDWVVYHL